MHDPRSISVCDCQEGADGTRASPNPTSLSLLITYERWRVTLIGTMGMNSPGSGEGVDWHNFIWTTARTIPSL